MTTDSRQLTINNKINESELSMSMLSHTSASRARRSGSLQGEGGMLTQAQFNKRLREVILEKQDQEQ